LIDLCWRQTSGQSTDGEQHRLEPLSTRWAGA